MEYVIGLDIGGSSTKIVCMNGREIVYKDIVYADTPKKCFEKAVEVLTSKSGINKEMISSINITGAGESFFEEEYMGYKLNHVQEFGATCSGALWLTGISKAVIVSMGTGTAFYSASQDEVKHLIGTGVGGGSLCGLSKLLLNMESVEEADLLALEGLPKNVDMTIGDISNGDMPGLPVDLTASNFGKKNGSSNLADIAAGMFNMVYQTIGTMTVMAMNLTGIKDVVLTGQVSTLKNCMRVLGDFNNFYGTNIMVPEDSSFATAIGACVKG